MKSISKLVFSYFSNFIAVMAAVNFIKGFEVTGGFAKLAMVAGILTLINFFIKPIFTAILSPLIALTLGLLHILINAVMLYVLDLLSADVNITSAESLIYTALIVSAINLILNFSAKALYKS